MVCINTRSAIALLFGVLLALGGCASGGGQKKAKASAVDEPEVSGEARAAIEKIPNPYLTQAVKIPPAAETAFRDALVAVQSEDWQTAERQLLDLSQKHPQLSGPLVNLGIVCWRQEKPAEAEKYFTQALTLNPLNNDAYVQMGLFLREQGRFAEAEQTYQKALEVWPHNAAAHRNLGILYDLYMGKFDAALKHYEMVLKLSDEPNKEVEGWIIDLKRRLAAG
ncbi:MAG: tetratricopeptide repeat protein [Cellvibrionaceae bacterium]|nr:tetratricopeptide repeat protein [Cellvibrionaceae bacterium]